MRLQTFTASVFSIAFGLASADSCRANGSVNYASKSVSLADGFQQPMQCILDALKERGYDPKDVGCFGERPNNRSAHPVGEACDVDQTSRNVTELNKSLDSAAQEEIAEKCNAVSGCKWGNPDCGHFENKGASYQDAGTPVGGGHMYSASKPAGTA